MDKTPIQTPDVTPVNTSGETFSTKARKSPFVKSAVSLGILGGIAGGVSACAPGEAPSTPGVSVTPDAKPSNAPETLSPDVANWVSPEEIYKMSPEELVDFATITVEEAPTPEDFAVEYFKVIQARVNAGGTKDEFAPYENTGTGTYEQAMYEKYDPVFDANMFGPAAVSSDIWETHKYAMNGKMGQFTLEDDVEYRITYTAGPSTVTVPIDDAGNFTISVPVEKKDNYNELKVSEIVQKPNIDAKGTSIINVQIVDGRYIVQSFES